MTRNQILKVLSTLTSHQVRHLLMGGQACVLYGAAEFSRDTDITVPAIQDNLDRLDQALHELQASVIAVPAFTLTHLLRGHAVHFRLGRPEVSGLRVDVMAVMRGVAPFDELWERRTTLELDESVRIDLLSLPDLVQAKKTQRDKDWPMIRRLVEAHYAQHRNCPTDAQVRFWLKELRTPTSLAEVAQQFLAAHQDLLSVRPLLFAATNSSMTGLVHALEVEEKQEREADRLYWTPLKTELERLRHQHRPK